MVQYKFMYQRDDALSVMVIDERKTQEHKKE